MTLKAASAQPVSRLDIRAPVRMGLAVIALFFVAGVGAAALAPIDKGVSLPGTVIAESKTKPVAHHRGGVVETVHVTEGQAIEAGDIIVSLKPDAIKTQIASLSAELAFAQRQLELARQEWVLQSQEQGTSPASAAKALALQRSIVEIEKGIAATEGRLSAAAAEHQGLAIRAPVSGRVLSISVNGPGAVVQAGSEIAEIVPSADKLVIEARLAPNQIENVTRGMSGKVWLTALSWREQRPLPATLAWISPDSIEDERTGASYFLARIEITEADDRANVPAKLQPGMRAEVLLLTGQRTLLGQLVDPLMRNVHRAFHG